MMHDAFKTTVVGLSLRCWDWRGRGVQELEDAIAASWHRCCDPSSSVAESPSPWWSNAGRSLAGTCTHRGCSWLEPRWSLAAEEGRSKGHEKSTPVQDGIIASTTE